MKEIMLSDCQLIVANELLRNIKLSACLMKRALAADDFVKITCSSDTLKIEDVLNKFVQLKITGTLLLDGIITKVIQSSQDQTKRFCLHIHSKLYLLRKSQHSRIFTQKKIPDILRTILEPYPFTISFSIKAKHLTYPLITQYQQSDFHFLQELAVKQGVFFYFDGNNLIITDHADETKSRALVYRSQAGLQGDPCVFDLKKTTALVSQAISLQDYNHHTARLTLKSTNQDSEQTIGHWLHFDNQAQDAAMQKQILHNIRNSKANVLITLKTTVFDLQLAQIITIANHPSLPLQHYYQLIQIKHFFTDHYYNECLLIPAEPGFRLAPFKKSYVGLQTATVFAPDPATPNLNAQGHYQIKMSYQSEAINAHLVRKMVQLTGHDQGQHFPLHPDSTVLLAYINGDINNPVILGSISDSKKPDLVTHRNSFQHLLRTESQQEFCIDHNPENPQLNLRNPTQALLLQENPARLILESQGELHLMAENTIRLQSQGHFQQSIKGQSFTTIQNSYQLNAYTVTLENMENSLRFNAKQATLFVSQQNILAEMTTQHLQTPRLNIQATLFDNNSKAAYETKTQTVMITAEFFLEICCGESRLSLDQQGNIHIQSQTLEFHCNSLENQAGRFYWEE